MNKAEEKNLFENFILQSGDGYVAEALRALKPHLFNAIDCDFSGQFAVENLSETLKQRESELSNIEQSICETGSKLANSTAEIAKQTIQLEEIQLELNKAENKLSSLQRASLLFDDIKKELAIW
jgi:hypothetical protein